jgi:DNA-binding NarL/FixJ family response regulator
MIAFSKGCFIWVPLSLVIPEQHPSAKGNPMVRIAIVDDHSVYRKSLRLMLERNPDFSVVAEAGDGITAIEMVEQFHPDVVLIDVRLPRMDGLEATRVIGTKHPQTRVIILSLFSDQDTKAKALEAGACSFCCKDSSPKEIIAAIRDGHQTQ